MCLPILSPFVAGQRITAANRFGTPTGNASSRFQLASPCATHARARRPLTLAAKLRQGPAAGHLDCPRLEDLNRAQPVPSQWSFAVSITLQPLHLPFLPRGALSEAVLARLTGADSGADHLALAGEELDRAASILTSDDVQLTLFTLYACAYGSLPHLKADLEWDLDLLATRQLLEAAFERELRSVVETPELPEPNAGAVAAALFALAGEDARPSLSRYFAKHATLPQ